jgi:hypothetical protein
MSMSCFAGWGAGTRGLQHKQHTLLLPYGVRANSARGLQVQAPAARCMFPPERERERERGKGRGTEGEM